MRLDIPPLTVTRTDRVATAAGPGPTDPLRPGAGVPRTGPTDSGLVREVEATLAAYLEVRTAEAAVVDPAFAAAVDALTTFVLCGGKRLRPTFAWWGWRGAGGAVESSAARPVLRAVSALELIQACALVHDDLMDASAIRRGRPTMHVEFAARHTSSGWRGGAAQFGEAAAILLGDLALVWADDLFHSCGLPADVLARAAQPWQAMRTELLGGQYLDVLHQATGDTSVAGALRIDRFKTAAYTVERPLHLGAALAGARGPLVKAYRRFGADIGVAFQLRDDLLGVFGDPAVTGKPAGDDVREGKRTLLLAVAVERADRTGDTVALATIEDAVGDPGLDDAGVDRIRAILSDLGAVAEVEQRITELTGSALDTLAGADIAEPAATELAALAVTATRRHR